MSINWELTTQLSHAPPPDFFNFKFLINTLMKKIKKYQYIKCLILYTSSSIMIYDLGFLNMLYLFLIANKTDTLKETKSKVYNWNGYRALL